MDANIYLYLINRHEYSKSHDIYVCIDIYINSSELYHRIYQKYIWKYKVSI